MADQEIKITLQDGKDLVVSVDPESDYKEIYIGLRGADGTWLQDLACIRPAYNYNEKSDVVSDPNRFDVLLPGPHGMLDVNRTIQFEKTKEEAANMEYRDYTINCLWWRYPAQFEVEHDNGTKDYFESVSEAKQFIDEQFYGGKEKGKQTLEQKLEKVTEKQKQELRDGKQTSKEAELF